MRRFILVFMMLFCTLASAAIAQDRIVKGKVTSKEDNSTLPGVNVVVKGTTKGTQTDMDGNYSISVPSGSNELQFTSIGMTTIVVPINNQSQLDVVMTEDAIIANEVVITGYSIQEKRELTGAVSVLKGDEIKNLPVQSLDRALQGRTAGVLVQSANGAPGGSVRVRIRGTGSINAGSDPLYVVDGVQINTQNTNEYASGNPLAFLNPNDIENIEILKDAAAASIYGAQAANGVVLITTKKGKAGKTNFNFSYYRGSVSPIQKMNVLNSQDYVQLRTEVFQNTGMTPAAARTRALGAIKLPGNLTDAEIAALPTYNWQNEAFRQGTINNAELSASGGTDKTTFFWSGAYNTEDANVVGVDFQRLTSRFNVTHKASDKLSFDASINLSAINQKGAFGSVNGGSFLGSPYFASSLIVPTNPVYNEDGSYFGLPATGGLGGPLNQNVIANANFNNIQSKTKQIVANYSVNYKIANGLTLRYFNGVDYRFIRGSAYYDPRTGDGYAYGGTLDNTSDENINYNTFLTLNFSKKIGEHKITGLLGTEYRSDVRESFYLGVSGFPTPQFQTANAASVNQGFNGFWSGFRRASLFAKADYNLKNKYFVSVVGRYDGSSRFGDGAKYGFFPAVSAAWAINEEEFMKNITQVSGLKVRASYGITGNDDIGNFRPRNLTGAGTNYNDIPGMAVSQLGDPKLRWEQSSTANVGLDMAFFEGRLTSTVEYFSKTTSGLLLDKPIPGSNGLTSYAANVGSMRNSGLEFEISGTILDMENGLNWKSSFNFTNIKNEVLKLNGDEETLGSNTSVRVGQPLGSIFTAQYAGVNPALGRPMWYDKNGNITYRPVFADNRIVGDSFAEIFGGYTNTLSYKGVEFSFTFQYENGKMTSNSQNSFLMENAGRGFNALQADFDRRWQKPGDITDVPRPINANAEVLGSNSLTGSRTIQDASYIRLKQVNLSYSLPKTMLKKYKLENVRVYAQALNLLTFTKWEGYDPEFVNLGSGNTGIIPQSRKYTFGVQIGF